MHYENKNPEVVALVFLMKAHMKKKNFLMYQISRLKIKKNYSSHLDYRDQKDLFIIRKNLLKKYFEFKPFKIYPNYTTAIFDYLSYVKNHYRKFVNLPEIFQRFAETQVVIENNIKDVKAQRRKYNELSAKLTLLKSIYRKNKRLISKSLQIADDFNLAEKKMVRIHSELYWYSDEIKRLYEAKSKVLQRFGESMKSLAAYKNLTPKQLELQSKLLIKTQLKEKLEKAKNQLEKYFKIFQKEKFKLDEIYNEISIDESTISKDLVSRLDILDFNLKVLRVEREGLKIPERSLSFALPRKNNQSIDDTLPLNNFGFVFS
ncbi:hypothetical protein SteCoe_37175 [Stentor coeruleus]|uniref:Uncharacterized protein n=1 Tax=Stentor coeruleus TaxID=5963 RepID=A0A1R2ANL2_9CILI|nr:hypothetical protein SteCoe_37175 [Stentor coeruleus]